MSKLWVLLEFRGGPALHVSALKISVRFLSRCAPVKAQHELHETENPWLPNASTSRHARVLTTREVQMRVVLTAYPTRALPWTLGLVFYANPDS